MDRVALRPRPQAPWPQLLNRDKGVVPQSRSSRVPCAPSNSTLWPRPISTLRYADCIRQARHRRSADRTLHHLFRRKQGARKESRREPVLLLKHFRTFPTKLGRVAQVTGAQSATSRLVLVSGSNTLGRGADLARPAGLLRGDLVAAMVRQDQMSTVADQQPFLRKFPPLMVSF